MGELAQKIGVPIVNNAIQLPSKTGNGFVKDLFIEEGFYVRYYHFTLNHDLMFRWVNESDKDDVIFKLLMNLEPGGKEDTGTKDNTEKSSILYSTDFGRTVLIKKEQLIKRVVILFTKKWLEENYSEASEKISSSVNLLIKKNKPTYIAENMDHSQFLFANELATEMGLEHFPLIHIKTKSLILLNSFLNKIVCRTAEDANFIHCMYYDEIAKVENRIKDYLDKPLPHLNILAAEFNMSPATMQRHFKNVYGKSIYHYYLEKKLALGKSMIASKNKSISEIAYTLGYNKINSFSKAFKKQYGVLPSDMSIYQAAS